MIISATDRQSPPNAESFEKLIGISKKRAYRMAFELTRNATDAEDLIQETYLKAWKGFDSYAMDKPFLNYATSLSGLQTQGKPDPKSRFPSGHRSIS